MASRLVESARPPKLARGMALVLDRDLEIRRRMIHRWNREMTSCRSVYSVGQKNQTGSLEIAHPRHFSRFGYQKFFSRFGLLTPTAVLNLVD